MALHKKYLDSLEKAIISTGINQSTARRMVKAMDKEHDRCISDMLSKSLVGDK